MSMGRNDRRDRAILVAFRDLAKAPSEIDRAMRLRRGTAHDVIVEWWLMTKVESKDLGLVLEEE